MYPEPIAATLVGFMSLPGDITIRHRIRVALLALAAALAGTVGDASASELLDRNASHTSLTVNSSGQAFVSWRASGRTRQVIAWGAINARSPRQGVPQVSFSLLYGGKSILSGGCVRYDGPPLAWLIRACKAPDGSYWALQSWQRAKPNYGGRRGTWDLRLSHWSGPLPQLQVWTDWAYRRYDHLDGRLSYAGQPVFGFRTTSQGNPLDTYGRNIYVDTYNSRYGSSWHRENGFLAQRPIGIFCYGFYPHGSRPSGKGTRYRATVIGPGVTPDVMWEGPAPGPYNKARELQANAHQRALFAGVGSGGCRPR